MEDVSPAPLIRQPPARWRKGRLKMHVVEPRETYEFAIVTTFQGPQFKAPCPKLRLHPIHHMVAFFRRGSGGNVFYHHWT
jgi:hypothetical protein